MEPLDYLRAIGRRWRIVLACFLLAGVGAYLTADPPSKTPQTSALKTWTATATLLQSADAGRTLAVTRLFMTRGEVPERVATALGSKQSGPELALRMTVSPDEQVGTISISASGTDPASTSKLVNTYATQSIAYFREQARAQYDEQMAELNQKLTAATATLEELDAKAVNNTGSSVLGAQRDAVRAQYQGLFQQRAQLIEAGTPKADLSFLERATPIPSTSTGFAPPSSGRGRLLLGALLGLMLGAALALVLDRLDTRLRRRDDVQRVLGAPVLTEVPHVGRRRLTRLPLVVDDPGSDFAESFRSLRSALTLLSARSIPGPLDRWEGEGGASAVHEPPSRVVLVVSPRAGDGKTTTIVNLAATIAAAGRKVLVVDADLRSPTLNAAFDVPPGRGLSEVASPDVEVPSTADLLRPTSVPGVQLLGPGSPELYGSLLPSRLGAVVEHCRSLADVVLLDTPPMLSANDAMDLMPHVDSVLVVVRSGRTSEERLRRTGELLARMHVPVLGTALIESRRRIPSLRLRSGGPSSSRRMRPGQQPTEVPGEVRQR